MRMNVLLGIWSIVGVLLRVTAGRAWPSTSSFTHRAVFKSVGTPQATLSLSFYIITADILTQNNWGEGFQATGGLYLFKE